MSRHVLIDCNDGPLESIIKVEPEEFESVENHEFYDNFNKSEMIPRHACDDQSYSGALESIIKVEPEMFTYSSPQKKPAQNVVFKIKPKDPSDKTIVVHNQNKKGRPTIGSTDGPCICDLCGKLFRNLQSIRNHMRHQHLKIPAPCFPCELCSKVCNTRTRLVEHVNQVHLNIKTYSCDVCDYKTAQVKCLKWHKKNHAPKTECPICSKLVSNLKRHSRCHNKAYTSNNAKHYEKVPCNVCGKVMMKHHLKRHLNMIHVKDINATDN